MFHDNRTYKLQIRQALEFIERIITLPAPQKTTSTVEKDFIWLK
jgi:hypothetical protein